MPCSKWLEVASFKSPIKDPVSQITIEIMTSAADDGFLYAVEDPWSPGCRERAESSDAISLIF
jgi:hypothetical protein